MSYNSLLSIEGRRKKEEGRRKREEGRGKREEGRKKSKISLHIFTCFGIFS
jgi:hypothetical protein